MPDKRLKRFDIRVINEASDEELDAAAKGTARDGDLVYVLDGKEHRTPIKTLRGDRRVDGASVNSLRKWEKSDFVPRPDDLLQERLYCIQWLDKSGDDSFYREVTPTDAARQEKVEATVRAHLEEWQATGLVPDMVVEPGEKTDEPIRTRGWT